MAYQHVICVPEDHSPWNRGGKSRTERTFSGLLLRVAGAAILWLAVPCPVTGQNAPEPASGGRIINVHEHLQSLAEVPRLLAAMDAVGIRKTVLLGSPTFTFTLKSGTGFAGYESNNQTLLRAVEMHPDRFEAWPTIDPQDPDKLKKLEGYIGKGASGLKLYLGHGYRSGSPPSYVFHTVAMDDPKMLPLYEYVQANNIPVMFHVNPGPTRPGFAAEFVGVLTRFPDMKVIAPHFILSSVRESRLRELLDTFPNLYSDISFGRDPYLKGGLSRISKNPQKFRNVFETYPDRFMYGTDVVVTDSKFRSAEWLADRFRAYIEMLTTKSYEVVVGRRLRLNGLGLPAKLSQSILYGNFAAFRAKHPRGSRMTRQINWARMGTRPAGRKGEAVIAPADDKDWATLKREALEAAQPKVRSSAIERLARNSEERRVLEILTEVLEKDPVPEIRGEALSAIEFFEAVPKEPVLNRLVADPVPAIRLQAVEIIEDEEWRGEQIEKVLLQTTNDPDGEIRSYAVNLLGEIEAWKVLEGIAKNHWNAELRELAAERLKDR